MKRRLTVAVAAVAVCGLLAPAGTAGADGDSSGTHPQHTVSPAASPFPAETDRLAGANRFETAAAVARALTDDPDVVYIVNAYDFPDSATGGARAGARQAPVLLTAPHRIPQPTVRALQHLGPSTVIIVGGTGVVSEQVERDLASFAGTVHRVAGADRYATAAALTADLDSGVDRVYLTTGHDFQHPMAAAVIAAQEDAALLLSQSTSLPPEVAQELQRLSPSELVVVGSTNAVSDAVAEEAAAVAGLSGHVRWAGSGPDDTARAVAEHLGEWEHAFIVSNLTFADGSAAVPLATSGDAPILFSMRDEVPAATTAALKAQRPSRITAVGGDAAISDATLNELADAVRSVDPEEPGGGEWGEPTWADEFDGTEVDPSKWRVRDDTYLAYDWAVISEDAVSVEDGLLRIRVSELDHPSTRGGKVRHWQTGYLDSIGLHEAQYGRWEIRAQIPTEEGASRGVWPAFWLRNGSVGEIDILEAWGGPLPDQRPPSLENVSRVTVHESTNGGQRTRGWWYEHQIWPGELPYETPMDFRVWAVEYTPDYLKAYLDGVLAVHIVPDGELVWGLEEDFSWVWGPTFANDPWSMRLNVQMGDDVSTPDFVPSPYSEVPADFLVDYVRFYEYQP